MKSILLSAIVAGSFLMMLGCVGCSDATTPSSTVEQDILGAETVVSQDLSQLSSAGIPPDPSDGVFSIGWNQFVGPAIIDAGTIGKSFVVVHDGTADPDTRPTGIDIGTVTLFYGSSSVELSKHVPPNGAVLYSTFSHGLRNPQTLGVNIPFISDGIYRFKVSGSGAFSPGSFEITAPSSLLQITSHKDGDRFDPAGDLTVTWSGGSPSADLLLRVVPHLRPAQLDGRGPGMGPDHFGPGPHRGGMPPGGQFLTGFGPEFEKGIIQQIPNTGSYTIQAPQLTDLLSGGEAQEVMVGLTQIVQKEVTHEGKTLSVLLKDGDRIVLTTQ